jgi:hypothetical protein
VNEMTVGPSGVGVVSVSRAGRNVTALTYIRPPPSGNEFDQLTPPLRRSSRHWPARRQAPRPAAVGSVAGLIRTALAYCKRAAERSQPGHQDGGRRSLSGEPTGEQD